MCAWEASELVGRMTDFTGYWSDDELENFGDWPPSTLVYARRVRPDHYVVMLQDNTRRHESVVFSSSDDPRAAVIQFFHETWGVVSEAAQMHELRRTRARFRRVDELLALKAGRAHLADLGDKRWSVDTDDLARRAVVAEAVRYLETRRNRRIARGVAESARRGTAGRYCAYSAEAGQYIFDDTTRQAYLVLAPLVERLYRTGDREHHVIVSFGLEPKCYVQRRDIHRVTTKSGFHIMVARRLDHVIIVPPDWMSSVHRDGFTTLENEICLASERAGHIGGYPFWYAVLMHQTSGFSVRARRRGVLRIGDTFLTSNPSEGKMALALRKYLRKASLDGTPQTAKECNSQPVVATPPPGPAEPEAECSDAG